MPIRTTASRLPVVRRTLVAAGLAVVAAATASCSVVEGDADAVAPRAAATTAAPVISLGKGFAAFPDAARAWVRANPNDPRAGVIASRIASQPTALWLTGDESFGNLRSYSASARAADRTMLLTLWNIPYRWDGLSSPTRLSLAGYQQWIDRVVAGIGSTRAVVVLEPDALWFYDRLPTDADRRVRLDSLHYAVAALRAKAPRTRVYIEAGTASGSVTPERMAKILRAVGVNLTAGYVANVSSYAPSSRIDPYVQRIRTALQHLGIANPRYALDSGRNGAPSWNNTWCNPGQQRLGNVPKLWSRSYGLDMTLWVKAPGTSDGSCGEPGRGLGSQGGEFLPAVAYDMAR